MRNEESGYDKELFIKYPKADYPNVPGSFVFLTEVIQQPL